MGRLAPLRTAITLPRSAMIIAGVLSVFVPVIALIAYWISFPDPSREVPYPFEMYIFFGWLPSLIILPAALHLAHRLNARQMNGWLLPPIAGTMTGALVGLGWAGTGYPEFVAYGAGLGALYGAIYWALSHGFAVCAARRWG